MAGEKTSDVAQFYDSAAADYHRMYQRENLLNSEAYPANYFRLQILVRRLAGADIRRVYEIGAGEGTPLATMAKMGFDVAGCDISDQMVAAARDTFARHGLDRNMIQWADAQDSTTMVGQLAKGQFDAVIAAGVLPHVRNDKLFLENTKMLLRPGGKVLIEFRNKLFSLFTMNRHTKEFILEDLLAGVSAVVRDAVAAELDQRLATNLPTPRANASAEAPSYDAVLSKFHNPLELLETFSAAGFKDLTIHWYHYHPAPPMLSGKLGEAFRREAMALEHEGSWRGMFLCSAGVVEGNFR